MLGTYVFGTYLLLLSNHFNNFGQNNQTFLTLLVPRTVSKGAKSPGLVVMGGDSRSKGRGFKSRRQILDGHDIFSH